MCFKALMGQTDVTFSSILTAEKDKIKRKQPVAEKVFTELYEKLRPALLAGIENNRALDSAIKTANRDYSKFSQSR